MRTLTLAAGCFWCLDAVYRQTRGVQAVVSGYIGGRTDNPDYRSVCSGTTGHAEAVRVTFDESIVPESVILGEFFTGHDPTSLNRQGNDVGTQYRSAMFYESEEQRQEFQQAIDEFQGVYDRAIVTTLEPMTTFYPAEDFHQDFYQQNPFNGYCTFIIDPKVAKARKQWADWLV